MTNLLILVKMQLKEQFNFKRRSVKGVGLFNILLSILAEIGKFAGVTALCYAFLLISQKVGMFAPITSPAPPSIISLLFFDGLRIRRREVIVIHPR